jgi:hypothetical protein
MLLDLGFVGCIKLAQIARRLEPTTQTNQHDKRRKQPKMVLHCPVQ